MSGDCERERDHARTLFLCHLALAFQRGLEGAPAHKVDTKMRARVWAWWGEAIARGIVLG